MQRRFSWAIFYTLIVLSACAQRLTDANHSNPFVSRLADFDWPGAERIVWSDTGQYIAASSIYRDSNYAQIFLVDVETGRIDTFLETKPGQGVIWATAWAPNGEEIAVFAEGGGTAYQKGIWIVSTAADKLETYLGPGEEASWSATNLIVIRDASVSPPQSLVFLRSREGEIGDQEVFRSEEYQITSLNMSSSGTEIVLGLRERTGQNAQDLYLLSTETGSISQLTTTGNNILPAWSPNGEFIAFIQYGGSDEFYSLHIVDKSGSCVLAIGGLVAPWYPAWSPSGKQIAFISKYDIYVLDLVGYLGESLEKWEELCSMAGQ